MARALGLPAERDAVPHAAVDDFTAFKQAVWRPYLHAAHLQALDTALGQVTRYIETNGAEGIGRLAVFMPPRHGKSQTVARMFPGWFLGRNPDRRIILTGYGAALVDKHSRAVRNLLATDAYRAIFPGVTLATDSAARASWDVAGREGGMDAAGIEGAYMGKGADLLLIDDPQKSRREAESKTLRDAVWSSYTDLYTRLEPGGAIVLIMTRWHDDDLAGRLLRQEGGDWTVIRLPALAEEGDPLGREPGAALWPERYGAQQLAQVRATLGGYFFASLYQQQPMPREGGLFSYDWIEAGRVAIAPERLANVIVAVDPAVSVDGDETGIVVVGREYRGNERHGYVLADGSMHGTPDAWARRAVALYRQYNADAIVIEVNQGGDMTAHTLRTVDPQVRVKMVRATDGKAIRAEPVAALYEQGRVHHVGEFPALEDQLTGWSPGAPSPDRLDALVWGMSELLLGGSQIILFGA